jgi:hypothetical protein
MSVERYGAAGVTFAAADRLAASSFASTSSL